MLRKGPGFPLYLFIPDAQKKDAVVILKVDDLDTLIV